MNAGRRWQRQFRGELRRLRAQREAWLGFAACLVVELVAAALLKLPAVRALAVTGFQQAHVDVAQNFSGLTTAAHLLGQTAMTTGALFIALIAGDAIAGERENGTLRLLLSRPVSRRRLWAQKLCATLVYTLTLTVFLAAGALAVGLLFEGPGRLFMVLRSENVLGDFDFIPGLLRYALATGLLALSLTTVALLAFTASCFPVKPATATALALSLVLADAAVRRAPFLGLFREAFLSTRLISWLHAFDQTIPWGMLRRYGLEVLALDLLLLLISAAAFHRLEPLRTHARYS